MKIKDYKQNELNFNECIAHCSIKPYEDYNTHEKFDNFDSYKLDLLRKKYCLICQDPNRRNKFFNGLDDWEKSFFKYAELGDDIIEKNKNRLGFFNDRGFEYNGEQYQDDILSLYMVSLSKVLEEDTTLYFLNRETNLNTFGKLVANPYASRVDSSSPITSDPDFLLVLNRSYNNKVIPIEQKCVYCDSWKIKIRENQYEQFSNLEHVFILIKKENAQVNDGISTYYDKYIMFDFNDIKDHMKVQHELNGRLSYVLYFNDIEKYNNNEENTTKILPIFEIEDKFDKHNNMPISINMQKHIFEKNNKNN
jgi:hypothetical protein